MKNLVLVKVRGSASSRAWVWALSMMFAGLMLVDGWMDGGCVCAQGMSVNCPTGLRSDPFGWPLRQTPLHLSRMYSDDAMAQVGTEPDPPGGGGRQQAARSSMHLGREREGAD